MENINGINFQSTNESLDMYIDALMKAKTKGYKFRMEWISFKVDDKEKEISILPFGHED